MKHKWVIDFDVVPGTPALATSDEQAHVAIELASAWHLNDAVEIKRLRDAGKLTTECTIDGKHVSLVLTAYE